MDKVKLDINLNWQDHINYMFNCSECGSKLTQLWHKNMPILSCHNCQGIGVIYHNATPFFVDHDFNQYLDENVKKLIPEPRLKCFSCGSDYKQVHLKPKINFLVCSKCMSFWFSKEQFKSTPFDTGIEHVQKLSQQSAEVTTQNSNAFYDLVLLPFSLEANANIIKKNEFPYLSTALAILMLFTFKTKFNGLIVFNSSDPLTLKSMIGAFLSPFAHFNLLSLICNVYFFLCLGPTLERQIGRTSLLLLFLLSNFSSLILAIFIKPGVIIRGAGISVAALAGAYIHIFPNARVSIFMADPKAGIYYKIYNFFAPKQDIIYAARIKKSAILFILTFLLFHYLALKKVTAFYHFGILYGFILGYIWGNQSQKSLNPLE